MIIDCDACAMQHTSACEDCIVPVLFDLTTGPHALNDEEATAIGHLADAGLVSPIRLIRRDDVIRDASAG